MPTFTKSQYEKNEKFFEVFQSIIKILLKPATLEQHLFYIVLLNLPFILGQIASSIIPSVSEVAVQVIG